MNEGRIKVSKDISHPSPKSVVYIMSRDQRTIDNHALHYANEIAIKNKLPLVVVFNLYRSVKGRSINHYEWMLYGLLEVQQELKSNGISFFLAVNKSAKELGVLIEENFSPKELVFDFSPLKGSLSYKETIIKSINTKCVVVDTHNVIPVWIASEKEEFAAYTFRPKVKKILKEYLRPLNDLAFNSNVFKGNVSKDFLNTFEVSKLLKEVNAELLVDYTPLVRSGQSSALQVMNEFISKKLENYFLDRNNPTEEGQSNLSAYLHFGNISSVTIALGIISHCKSKGVELDLGGSSKQENLDWESADYGTRLKISAESFLEELIVRKELADNFCFYNKNYDSIQGAKPWAQSTLSKHEKDKRIQSYSIKIMESAATKDDAWNAAQNQLIRTGKIHGYMRMYWAKKVLEWTKNAEEAVKILIYLNDKYSLDGYDPNGYVGILWSIGGVHDRPWFERSIFGQIRYMNANGLMRKFDLKKYLNKWL